MTETTPERKGWDYALSLGVNSTYDEAVAFRNELERVQQTLHELRGRKRDLEHFRSDVEMEVIEETRRTHPDWSVAEFDRQIKVVFSNESRLREVRDDLLALEGDIDLANYQITLIKADIDIRVARLTELGGLLQYMAVLKGTSEAKRSQATPSEADILTGRTVT